MLRWVILFFSVTACLNVIAAANLTSLNDNGIQQWEAKIYSAE